jgi:hypothetical protein
VSAAPAGVDELPAPFTPSSYQDRQLALLQALVDELHTLNGALVTLAEDVRDALPFKFRRRS